MARSILTIAPVVLATLLFTSPAVRAQESPDDQDLPPAVEMFSEADAKAVLNARLAALKTVMELTPAQEALWAPLEAAIRQGATAALERRKQRAQQPPPMDFVDVLDRVADAEITRGQSLKSIAAAARPLVASLSEDQKRRIPAFIGMTDSSDGPQSTDELWFFEDEQN